MFDRMLARSQNDKVTHVAISEIQYPGELETASTVFFFCCSWAVGETCRHWQLADTTRLSASRSPLTSISTFTASCAHDTIEDINETRFVVSEILVRYFLLFFVFSLQAFSFDSLCCTYLF